MRASIRRDLLLQAQGWYDRSARSELDPVFIGGCGRSGTTLFKELLNRQSRCACGPETSLFGLPFNIDNIAAPWDIPRAHLLAIQSASSNLIEFADRFAGEFLETENKSRWIEKTPNNVRAIDRLLTWYPNGRFIHLIRDGRDVVCSLRHHPRERIVADRVVPIKSNNPVERSATRWLNDTMSGLAFREHPRCLEVRYESLVLDPENEMKRVCSFIGEPFEPQILDTSVDTNHRRGQNLNNERAARSISPKSIARWESDLTGHERKVFVDIAGELLIALGYVPDHSWAGTRGDADG